MDFSEYRSRQILGFSDTFGIEAGNGVARFLHDMHRLNQNHQLPLKLVVPAREETAPGLLPIRAPAFTVPGYGQLKISMPLRHHRKIIERQIKNERPDCVHVSTPGPFGCFGLTLARRYRLPLVGIYHTDFTRYASAIVQAQLANYRSDPQRMLAPVQSKLLPMLFPLLGKLSAFNPQMLADVATIGEILSRNFNSLSADGNADEYLSSLAGRLTTNVLKKFYQPFHLLIARSPAQRETLAADLGINPNRVRCLQPGTDVERFHPMHKDRSVWAQHGVPDDAFVVLYVGRVTAEKNIDFLHRIWSRIQTDHPSDAVHLVVVGHGEQRQVDRLNSLPHVHTIGSHRGPALSKLYASSDLLVFPSTTETLGQVGLEAGASGLPVVVSDQGGPQMYVRHGETGFVLPTDDPSCWAEQILTLAGSRREQVAKMGMDARDHIAGHFTLDHTLKSYWDLHREAVEIQKTNRKQSGQPKWKPRDRTELQGRVPSKGVMVISDFHGGKRYASQLQRDQKRAAIRAMLELAIKRDLEVVFGGDFGDHGARLSRLEADFQAFRRTREELGFRQNPILVRGNHDYGFSDQRLEELTGGCRVHDSLVYHQPAAGVTVCHGHIFSLARTVEVIRTSRDVPSLIAQLHEDRLDEELKPAIIAYDIANMIELGLADQGLRGLSTAWEGFYSVRAKLAEQLLKFAKNSSDADEATWKMIAGLVGTHDNVEVAAMLGIACGGWASLFGHTHEPLVKSKRVRLHDDAPRSAQVVANSGHINRKHPTCAVAEFPAATIFQYDWKSKKLRPLRQARLSDNGIEAFSQRIHSDGNTNSFTVGPAVGTLPSVGA